jgi:hypothetical protein
MDAKAERLAIEGPTENPFQGLTLGDDEIEECRDSRRTAHIGRRHQAPGPRQLRNRAQHAYQILFIIGDDGRQWREGDARLSHMDQRENAADARG